MIHVFNKIIPYGSNIICDNIYIIFDIIQNRSLGSIFFIVLSIISNNRGISWPSNDLFSALSELFSPNASTKFPSKFRRQFSPQCSQQFSTAKVDLYESSFNSNVTWHEPYRMLHIICITRDIFEPFPTGAILFSYVSSAQDCHITSSISFTAEKTNTQDIQKFKELVKKLLSFKLNLIKLTSHPENEVIENPFFSFFCCPNIFSWESPMITCSKSLKHGLVQSGRVSPENHFECPGFNSFWTTGSFRNLVGFRLVDFRGLDSRFDFDFALRLTITSLSSPSCILSSSDFGFFCALGDFCSARFDSCSIFCLGSCFLVIDRVTLLSIWGDSVLEFDSSSTRSSCWLTSFDFFLEEVFFDRLSSSRLSLRSLSSCSLGSCSIFSSVLFLRSDFELFLVSVRGFASLGAFSVAELALKTR